MVALSAGLLSAGFCYTQQIQDWFIYGCFSLFSTLAVYNGQRLYKSSEKNATEWLVWVNNHRIILIVLVVFSTILSALLFFLLDNQIDVIYLIFLLVCCISILYVVRINGRNMRELPYVKIHLIAITWVFVLIIFPLMNEEINTFNIEYILAFYVYFIAVIIPFDIRDLKYDFPSQKTIPQLIGVRNSKIISVLLLGLFFALMITIEPLLMFNFFFIISVIIQLFLLLFMNKSRGDFYCAGLIDGAIGLMGLSMFVI